MGFFTNGSGSKLKNPANAAAEQAATIPVVTDTVEEDTAAAYAQKSTRRNGMKSTLLSNPARRIGSAALTGSAGNTTLG